MIDQLNLKQFNRIYEETYPKILRYIVSKCSNMEDVNDIIQETYFAFYKAMKEEKKIEDEERYILAIARNKINKHYTFLYRIQTLFSYQERDVQNILKSGIDVEKMMIQTHDLEKIWNYLKTKKLIIQKIFYLYYELDLTIKEISQELEIGESYTKNCLYRTLKELQEILRKDCD